MHDFSLFRELTDLQKRCTNTFDTFSTRFASYKPQLLLKTTNVYIVLGGRGSGGLKRKFGIGMSEYDKALSPQLM